jgi:hypothetical protein
MFLFSIYTHFYKIYLKPTTCNLLQFSFQSHLNLFCIFEKTALHLVLHSWKEVKITRCESMMAEFSYMQKQQSHLGTLLAKCLPQMVKHLFVDTASSGIRGAHCPAIQKRLLPALPSFPNDPTTV